MKLVLKDIIKSEPALNELVNLDLPAKVAYSLSKTANKIKSELNEYRKLVGKLREKYGEIKDKKIVVKPENEEQFKKEVDDLINVEVEIDIWKINLSNLISSKTKAAIFMDLDYLINDDTEVNERSKKIMEHGS